MKSVGQNKADRSVAVEALVLEERILMSATPLDPNLALEGSDGETGAGGLDALPNDLDVAIDFSDASNGLFDIQSGDWTVADGRYDAVPDGDAISTLAGDVQLLDNVSLSVTINADPVSSSFYSNAFLIFDYQTETDFKFAGAYVGSDEWVIGHRSTSGWRKDATVSSTIDASSDYDLTVTIQDGNRVTLFVDGAAKVAQSFGGSLTDGEVGLGTWNAVSHFDNFAIQQTPTDTMSAVGQLPLVEHFDDGTAEHLDPQTGSWSLALGRYIVTPDVGTDGVSLVSLSEALPTELTISATINVDDADNSRFGNGFVIFDYQSSTDFKFAGFFATRDEVAIGHRTAGGWESDASLMVPIDPFADYNVSVQITGGRHVALTVGEHHVEYEFSDDVIDGPLGLGTYNSVARFDDVMVVDQTPEPSVPSISVQMQGRDLVIAGESSANVSIVATQNDTLQIMEGSQLVAEYSGFKGSLRIELGDGDDDLSVDLGGHTFRGNLIIDAGAGADTVTVQNGTIGGHLIVNGRAGDDHIELNDDLYVKRHAKVRSGEGDDGLTMNAKIGRGLWFRGGTGDDQLTIGGSVRHRVFASMGDGNDEVSLLANAEFGRSAFVALGHGDDEFHVDPSNNRLADRARHNGRFVYLAPNWQRGEGRHSRRC